MPRPIFPSFQPLLLTVLLAFTRLNAQSPANAHASTSPAQDAQRFTSAPGISIEPVAAEPLLQNPVAFSIDDLGRFFIAETHRWDSAIFDVYKLPQWVPADLALRTVADRERFLLTQFATNTSRLTRESELIRLIDAPGPDGQSQTSRILAQSFNTPVSGVGAGILAWDQHVFYTCIPDLWRLHKPDPADSTPVTLERLATGFGVHTGISGHDLHGLTMGPDGRIYFSSGDRGFSVRTREGRLLDSPDTGAVLRCDPDGSHLEVFATGLRNPQELAFDDLGNLWTDDNDTAGADPSRLLHLVRDGDYGWRCSYQHMSGFGPWVLEELWKGGASGILPPAGDVAQGPCGIAFHPGSGPLHRYRNHLFICDFPGGIWACTVKPAGASYVLEQKSKLVWNAWPTDIDFGPDGTPYFLDWVTGWTQPNRGRIYRLTTRTASTEPVSSSLRDILPRLATASSDQLVLWLAHPDRRARLRAQFELVRRGGDATRLFSLVIDQATERLPRLHALWGLGQLSRAGLPPAPGVFDRALEDQDPEIRAQAASVLGDLGLKSATPALARHLADPDPRARFHCALALAHTATPQHPLVAPVIAALDQNADRDLFLTHALVRALGAVSSPAELHALHTHASIAVRRGTVLALRQRGHRDIGEWLTDPSAAVALEAARGIYDTPIPAAFQALAQTVTSTRLPQPGLERALRAQRLIGHKPQARTLASLAANTNTPPSHRLNALRLLANWSIAQTIDPIVGLHRPIPPAKAADASDALRPILPGLLQSATPDLALQAAQTADQTGIAISSLPALIQDRAAPPQVRAAALRGLQHHAPCQFQTVFPTAFNDPSADLRRVALELLAKSPDQHRVQTLADAVNNPTDHSLATTALDALAEIPDPPAESAWHNWLDQLTTGKLRPDLAANLLDAATHTPFPSVHQQVQRWKASALATDPLAPYRVALQPGSIQAGRRVFFEVSGVECSRCHTIQGEGGTVGPNLSRIGAQQSPEYILESIVYPNRRIARGFESILVSLKDGTLRAGIVESETPEELVLQSPEDGRLHLKSADIRSRSQAQSAMPEELGRTLSYVQLRDLVSFLSSLR